MLQIIHDENYHKLVVYTTRNGITSYITLHCPIVGIGRATLNLHCPPGTPSTYCKMSCRTLKRGTTKYKISCGTCMTVNQIHDQ